MITVAHARISWRKVLIRHRPVFCEAWRMAFPKHDLVTGRLRRDSLDGFDELVERLAKSKARESAQRSDF
jgi:hypothetical protein